MDLIEAVALEILKNQVADELLLRHRGQELVWNDNHLEIWFPFWQHEKIQNEIIQESMKSGILFSQDLT